MRFLIFCVFSLSFLFSIAQSPSQISETSVSRIENTLASDDMQGRKVFTPGIEKAAAFINNEFKNAGLHPWPGAADFNQTFMIVDPVTTEVSATLDGNLLGKKNVVVLSADSTLNITETSNYKKVFVKTNTEFSNAFYTFFESNEQTLIFVDSSLAKRFSRLSNRHIPQFSGSGNRLFILREQVIYFNIR
jgi:hypothetical protein